MKDTTIAAISTPQGKGGIAVIRISGSGAISVADRMFRSKSGKKLADVAGCRTVYGDILHGEKIIDDGIAVVFRAPHSFTGEDTVEINCHGGILISQMVLESAFICGAVQAEAGEFTMRAFMSGNISLSQAEAVIDKIDAESRGQIDIASSQGRGFLTREIDAIYEKIKNLLAALYVTIDFPEEDLSSLTDEEIKSQLAEIKSRIEKLSSTYSVGHAVAEGIPVVIIGKPNTGKSSLLNLMSGRDRAIVTSEAGTTRDIIEETVQAGRVLLRLSDTAGIRNADSEAEKIGVSLALERINSSELVLAVFDNSSELCEDDYTILEKLEEYKSSGGHVIAVINKTDLENRLECSAVEAKLGSAVCISAKAGDGYDALIKRIEELYFDGEIELTGNAIVSNARQYSSLVRTAASVGDALTAHLDGFPADLVGVDLELALSELGRLDGKAVTEEVVHSIFSRFCVGK